MSEYSGAYWKFQRGLEVLGVVQAWKLNPELNIVQRGECRGQE